MTEAKGGFQDLENSGRQGKLGNMHNKCDSTGIRQKLSKTRSRPRTKTRKHEK
jgi:hypothetical protein